MGIRLSHLTRRFGKRLIFQTPEWESPSFGILSLNGPNGSGKTTFLKTLSTLILPTSGEAWIDGVSILANPHEVRRRIGFVTTGEGGFIRKLNGRENLILFGILRGINKKKILYSLDSYRSFLSLEDALTTPIAHCSSGMRQSLAIARSLLHQPKLLLLDEPTRSLDSEARRSLLDSLNKLSHHQLMLLATHRSDEQKLGVNKLYLEKSTLRIETPHSLWPFQESESHASV